MLTFGTPQAAVTSDTIRWLTSLIALLPSESQRACLRLELAGLDRPEVAQVLDRTPHAVKCARSRAVATLKNVLGAEATTSGGAGELGAAGWQVRERDRAFCGHGLVGFTQEIIPQPVQWPGRAGESVFEVAQGPGNQHTVAGQVQADAADLAPVSLVVQPRVAQQLPQPAGDAVTVPQRDHGFDVEQGVPDDDVPISPVRHEQGLCHPERLTAGGVTGQRAEPVENAAAVQEPSEAHEFLHLVLGCLVEQPDHVDGGVPRIGGKGPVALPLTAFEQYQQNEAETWEHLALTRARPVAGDPALCRLVAASIRRILLRERDPARLVADVGAMRRLLASEKGDDDAADLKNMRGGLVDIDFCAQFLMLAHASRYSRLLASSIESSLTEASAQGLLAKARARTLIRARSLFTELLQRERLRSTEASPMNWNDPSILRNIARDLGAGSGAALTRKVEALRADVKEIYDRVVIDSASLRKRANSRAAGRPG